MKTKPTLKQKISTIIHNQEVQVCFLLCTTITFLLITIFLSLLTAMNVAMLKDLTSKTQQQEQELTYCKSTNQAIIDTFQDSVPRIQYEQDITSLTDYINQLEEQLNTPKEAN